MIGYRWRPGALAAAALLALPGAASAQAASPRTILFDSLTWRGGNGIELATVSGDPAAPDAPYVVALRLAPGRWIAPHWHPHAMTVVVLSGTFRIGFGDTIDSTSVRRLGAGGAADVPATAHHFEGAVGTTVVLLTGIGPMQTTMVMPMPAPASATTAPASIPRGAETIESLRSRYVTAYNAGDAAAMVPLYEVNAARMSYDAKAQQGRDEIVGGYQRTFAQRSFMPTLTLIPDSVIADIGTALERGRYHEVLTSRNGGAALIEDGKYVSVMVRGADHTWRYLWSIFNRDAPARPSGSGNEGH